MLEHGRSRTGLRLRIAGAAVPLAALALSAGAGSAFAKPVLQVTGNAPVRNLAPVKLAPQHASPNDITIIPTFDSSITEAPHAGAIEKSIKLAIARLERRIATPTVVNIEFASVSTGLGASATYYGDEPYSQYRADLERLATTKNDKQALSTLPEGPNNPVNGSTEVHMTLPLLRATGETELGNAEGHVDSSIFLNMSIINETRSKQDPEKYDLQQVVTHEMDETLGVGGAGSGVAAGTVGSLDLYRYSAPGVRTYSNEEDASSYFSIDGGLTNLSYFNQSSGGDKGDWSSEANGFPQVQDAFSTPGVRLNPDHNEYLAFDIAGYKVRY